MNLRSLFLNLLLVIQAPSAFAAFCSAQLGGAEGQSPRLEFLKRDLPQLQDPIKLVFEFKKQQQEWNLAHPSERNNFKASFLSQSVNGVSRFLESIKTPAQLRLKAQRLLAELKAHQESGFPYKDTFVSLVNASSLLTAKYRTGYEMKRAMNSVFHYAQLIPHEAFRYEIAQLRAELVRKYKLPYDASVFSTNLLPQDGPGSVNWNFSVEFSREVLLRMKRVLHDENHEGAKKVLRKILDDEKSILERELALRNVKGRVDYLRYRISVLEDILDPHLKSVTGLALRLHDPVDTEIGHDGKWKGYDINFILESGVFIPVAWNQSLEGLTEAFLLGLRPVQVSKNPMEAHDRYWGSLEFLEHDAIFHGLIGNEPIPSTVLDLSWGRRIEILLALEKLSPRQKKLAYFAIFDVIHEGGNEFASYKPDDGGNLAKSLTQVDIGQGENHMTLEEARWLLSWYFETVNQGKALDL